MEHQPINLQLRITDASYDNIRKHLGWYITDKHMAFKHTPKHNTDNVHHHVYLFGCHRTAETLRNLLRKHYDKSKFAVSVTAGKTKQKITPMLAYQYAMNPKSQPEIVKLNGWTIDELADFKKNADEYYAPVTATLVTKEEHYIVRPDRVWERLKQRQAEGHYDNLTIQAIKSKLASEWLNAGKAIMRNADAHRYAVSIFMLNKYKTNPDGIPETAFMGEYNISNDLV